MQPAWKSRVWVPVARRPEACRPRIELLEDRTQPGSVLPFNEFSMVGFDLFARDRRVGEERRDDEYQSEDGETIPHGSSCDTSEGARQTAAFHSLPLDVLREPPAGRGTTLAVPAVAAPQYGQIVSVFSLDSDDAMFIV